MPKRKVTDREEAVIGNKITILRKELDLIQSRNIKNKPTVEAETEAYGTDDTRTELYGPGEPGLMTRMVEKGIQQQY